MRILFFLVFTLSLPLFGDGEPEKLTRDPQFSVTEHTYKNEEISFSYTATTGFCPLLDEKDEVEAKLFFIAYTKKGEEDRPITFVFPGGPGDAGTLSSILALGPRRLLTSDEGRTILPPYQIIDNPETLLTQTDLVFIDPPSCGYSKMASKEMPHPLCGVEGDIYALGDFIHHYLSHFDRWTSPKYLLGGSYGTLRACGVALNLLRYHVAVNGLILNGCALDYTNFTPGRDKFLPDCLRIPTFAATAWYHKRLFPEKPLSEVLETARRFAIEEYAPAMLAPSRLNATEKELLFSRLAEFTGLPLSTIKRYNGRINEKIFTSEFFSPERKILGGLDSRHSSDVSTLDPGREHDPSYLPSIGIDPAFHTYLKKELDTYFPLQPYVRFSNEAYHFWNFRSNDSRGEPDFTSRLRRLLIVNPLLKVFVASGYYDCRTPFAGTEYYFEHLDLPLSYQKQIQFNYYEGGHIFILDYPCLKKFKKDLDLFYDN